MDSAYSEVEINGHVYRVGKLTVRKSLHVARRLIPFLGAIVPHLKTLFKPKSLDVPSRVEFFERAAEVIPDLAEIISQLSDEDVDYVLDACLAVVQVKQERGWSQVVSNGILMFQSADLKTQLQLTAEVVKFNLSDFFDSSQPKEPEAAIVQ
jgi:hypothetical protein